ncbi:hypothetical protein B0H21DRAFT_757904 [Amylocystis lapponica]|nr:hypothetical protein B0H21DRAFT_757904 [Amylocystis lapponica]
MAQAWQSSERQLYKNMTSACNRCLQVDDIFQVVLEQLYDEENQRSIASLAATCRTFREPSLSVLWADMYSLVPLLKLFPSHTWTEVVAANGDTVYKLTRPGPLDLTRVVHYAQYIKSFHWGYEEDVSVDTLLRFFSQCPPDGQLFPNVRVLEWCEYRPELFGYVSVFAGANLSTFDIDDLPEDPPLAARVLADIRTRCVKLEVLIASGHMDDPAVSSALSRLLDSSAANLCHVNVRMVLDSASVLVLARMPRLRMAYFPVCPRALDALHLPTDQVFFPALQVLHMNLDTLDTGTLAFFRAIQSPAVGEIALRVKLQPYASILEAHFETLSDAFLHLHTLSFMVEDAHRGSINGSPERVVTNTTLQALLRLSSLTELSVNVSRLDISAPFVTAVARALPSLESLCFSAANSTYVPLETLRAFAEHCEDLETLGLPIDARVAPDVQDFVSYSPLDFLCVGESPIARPARVAAFLLETFPSLRTVMWSEPAGPQDAREARRGRNWLRMEKRMEALRSRKAVARR